MREKGRGKTAQGEEKKKRKKNQAKEEEIFIHTSSFRTPLPLFWCHNCALLRTAASPLSLIGIGHIARSGYRFALSSPLPQKDMVGVPRSTGCQLCVKRKVKCDQGKPGCGNCRKYGAQCPGYEKGFKFVAGKHHVRRRHQLVLHTSSSEGNLSDGASTSTAFPQSSFQRAEGSSALVISPAESPSQFVSSLLQNLAGIELGEQLLVLAPWFSYVPDHLGRDGPLGGAASAFILHLLGKADGNEALVHRSRFAYGQSLTSLQRALNHPTRWRLSETLCAAMTMCLFEVGSST